LKIKKYFDKECFTGYEGPTGYYAVYRSLFETIKMQEEKANTDGEYKKMPGFGDENTNPIEVGEFYDKWRIFETVKKF